MAFGTGTVSVDGLLEARRQGRLVGAILFQEQAGKAALVWPPGLVPGEPAETAIELLAAAAARLGHAGIRIATVLLDRIEAGDDLTLRTGGFRYLAELAYLASTEQDFPVTCPQDALEFEPYRSESHGRLAGLVEETYQDSLDCPAMDGLRDIGDVLAGYRAAGEFAPQRWQIVRHADRDVGCLLLADHADVEQWELVYMGLTKAARGRGWGKAIVRRAQWLTRQAGRPRLVLAVDAANRPALEAYSSTGFRLWAKRSVYLRPFPASA